MTGDALRQFHKVSSSKCYDVLLVASLLTFLAGACSCVASPLSTHGLVPPQFVPRRVKTGTAVSGRANQLISLVCNSTPFPQVCKREIVAGGGAAAAGSRNMNSNKKLQVIVLVACKSAYTGVADALSLAKNLSVRYDGRIRGLEKGSLKDCIEVLADGRDQVRQVLSQLRLSPQHILDMRVALSAALTDQTTCADGLASYGGSMTKELRIQQDDLSQVLTNALSLVSTVLPETQPGSPPSPNF